MRDGSPRKPCGMILPPPAPRNRGRGKRRASPPPAEPSPFGNPLPGTPLHHRNSQRGRALCAHSVAPRGEDAARGRPSPRPSGHGACKPLPLLRSRLPPRGRPGSKAGDKERTLCGSVLHASASLRRQARYLCSVTILAKKRKARALAPARPPRVRERLRFAPAHSPALPSALEGLPGMHGG